MNIDKPGRVRSYVHAQLAFVPFYGADLLGPSDALPETFSLLHTPILTARNPLVTIQQEFGPPASAPLEVRGSNDGTTQAKPTLTRKTTEDQKRRPAKHPLRTKQRKRLIGMTRDTRKTPDPEPPSDPAEELTPVKRERRRRREKPRLPTGLSFLYGFAPQNVGPSRLTMPAGDRGVFGKGKTSSTVVGFSLPDFTDLRLPPTPSNEGFFRSEFPCSGKQQPPRTGKFVEEATSQPEQTEGTPGDCSTTWDIELEDGNLPSDSSSFACGTTVVIDTGKIWNHQGVRQFHQTAVDCCGNPQSVAPRSPDECSRSSPRVASRFFLKYVPSSGLHKGGPAPRTPTLDWEDNTDKETEVPTLDDFGYCRCSDVGWDRGSNQETDSFLGGYCGTQLSPLASHQEMVTGWSDVRGVDTSFVESTNSEGGNLRGSPLGVCVLSDRDASEQVPEQVHCFSEGRRLLLGI